uniref:SJCHGC01956 protein n=1 Tax=Schistosoma japonicum TaxID=6182 RepID=Q5DBC1_SCHJA|nr:SJCHGC01956 protein [Schistosoma japonicum]
MHYICSLILYYLTWTYYSTYGIVYTTIHKQLLPYYYMKYQKPYYYSNKKLANYDYYPSSYQYYSSYPYAYSTRNYQIIPGIEKLKTIETETMQHIKEFSEISTEYKKSDKVLPSLINSEFNANDVIDDSKELEQFIGYNQDINNNHYNFGLSSKSQQTQIPLNRNLNRINNTNYRQLKQQNISPSNSTKQINNNNNKPYSSKQVETKSNEKFTYDKQIIKQRESSHYIVLRPWKKRY